MDAIAVILNEKVCVYMVRGVKWVSESGVTFTREHPYQLLNGPEAMRIIRANPERFREASKDEVSEFYGGRTLS